VLVNNASGFGAVTTSWLGRRTARGCHGDGARLAHCVAAPRGRAGQLHHQHLVNRGPASGVAHAAYGAVKATMMHYTTPGALLGRKKIA